MTSTVETLTTITVNPELFGQRLDLYLAQQLPQFSRSFWKNLITSEKIKVNGQLEFHPQYRVKTGDVLTFHQPDQIVSNEIEAVEIPLNIVYENTEFLVINKPVGLVVHPAAAHQTDTLANGIKYYLGKKAQDLFGPERAGVVHRLDKETSGLILIAKTPQSLWLLSKLFAERAIHKSYLAVVKGEPEEKFTVNKPLGRSKFNRQKFSQHTAKSRIAETEFQVLSQSPLGYALVLAKPKTGRTHQIRVHLSESGYPIVGDLVYGGEKAERMLLHAFSLDFSVQLGNATTAEKFHFSAAIDPLFQQEAKARQIDLGVLSKLE